MQIIGHGIDIVEIARFKATLARQQSQFELNCFTVLERQIAGEAGVNRVSCLAGRFAAKEAVLKALGTGWSQGITWTDVEIQRLATGCPSVNLHAKAAQVANQLSITNWFLSISHEESYAVASAIAISSD
ncbi:holo-(acyl-carrier-protein) synthase [Leptolyngbya sp. PCC 7375]|nr:holo-(acyl-carrier-protein) synthase [Leptolyngbya sp. PCC 7375]